MLSPSITILDTCIIESDASYHGWPTIARTRSGELLAVASGGRKDHVDPFGKVYLLRSTDQGKSWSSPQTLVDGPYDDRDAGIIETRQGTLLVNWFNSLAWLNYLYRQETGQIDWIAPATTATWRPVREHIAINVVPRKELGDWLIRSTDGGLTWSERIATGVNSPHGPIEGKSGRLFYVGKCTTPPAKWIRGSAHEEGEVGLAASDDDGCSWHLLSTIPLPAGHSVKDYHEPHMAEAGDNTLVVQIRKHDSQWIGETVQTESHDGGQTWSPIHSIGVWGQPSHLLKLKDDRLLMTYGYRRAPFGNQARISIDCGKTWSDPLTISGDGTGIDLGYPSTVQMDDGMLITLWYEGIPNLHRAVLRQARWRIT